MCKRSDNDPLVRALTDRYKLNILRIPRQGVGVGELLVREGNDLKSLGSIRHFFDPELELQEVGPTQLPDIGGLTSSRFSAKVAASPLSGLLGALGVIGISSVEALLNKTRDVSVVFGLTDVQYRMTDLVVLGNELTGRALRRDNALYVPGREFFVAHAVAQTMGMQVRFAGATEEVAKVALNVEQLIDSEGSIRVARSGHGYLAFSGSNPITFGLAVVRLELNGSDLKLQITNRLSAVRKEETIRETPLGAGPDIFFGGDDGEMLVDIR